MFLDPEPTPTKNIKMDIQPHTLEEISNNEVDYTQDPHHEVYWSVITESSDPNEPNSIFVL